jgi:hypothetical protein
MNLFFAGNMVFLGLFAVSAPARGLQCDEIVYGRSSGQSWLTAHPAKPRTGREAMKTFKIHAPVYLLVAWSLALSGCLESANSEPFDTQDPMPLVAEEAPPPQEPELIVADNSTAIFDFTTSLSAANYQSGWTSVSSSSNANIAFDAGFLPRLVSVLVQMRDCNGNWVSKYTYVPPAHSSWDDMYTGGENVYWVENNSVYVHHEGAIRGTNIHDGCSSQRFKVYAWR